MLRLHQFGGMMIGKTTHNDEKENSAGGDDDNSRPATFVVVTIKVVRATP